MIPTRQVRIMLAGLMTLGLVVGALTAPAVTLAKTPNWSAPDVAPALPATVRAGSLAGFELNFMTNSNISRLYLFTQETREIAFVSDTDHCNPSGRLYCTFSGLRRGDEITVVVAYQTTDADAGDMVVHFEWNTTGIGSGSSDNSHGDALTPTGTVHVVTSNDPNYLNVNGAFLLAGIHEPLATGEIGGTNLQSSILYPPTTETAIAASVSDGTEGTCPAPFTCFGEATYLTVGNGSPDYGLFKVVVTIDASLVPPGTDPSQVGVVHVFDNPPGGLENITNDCPTSGTPTSQCRTVEVVSTGAAVATFSSHHDDECDSDHDGYWWWPWWWRDHDDDDDCSPTSDTLQITVWLAQNGFIKYH
jgi:hypothetical protein